MDKKYFVRKVDEMKRITQTAGRNALKEFSLEFAHFNDDILLVRTGITRISILRPEAL